MTAILSLSGVTKSYGALVVADDVGFDVPPGQALGIIGQNGAGESTLFNLITSTVAADAGSIRFDGRDVTRMPARACCLAGMGRSFQIPQPFGSLTVFENLSVAAAFGRGLPERAVTADCAAILERTGLIARANAPVGGLSLLDRKRLELARALATGPRLLLLDEIAGGPTDGECRSLVDTIREINAAGTTIVWIEHVLHALTAVVERLLVLDFGRVIADGPPDAVMAGREVREI